MVADHLSQLVPEITSEGLPIGDTFPNEQLFALVHCPWYADIVNISSDRTDSTPMDLSSKEEIFCGHKKILL